MNAYTFFPFNIHIISAFNSFIMCIFFFLHLYADADRYIAAEEKHKKKKQQLSAFTSEWHENSAIICPFNQINIILYVPF